MNMAAGNALATKKYHCRVLALPYKKSDKVLVVHIVVFIAWATGIFVAP
jgi:hypothetical protein